MEYAVKNVKTFRGREGEGFNADLFLGSRKIALVNDDANGGCYRYYWIDKDREQAKKDEKDFIAYAKSLPAVTLKPANSDEFVIEMDADLLIDHMVEDVLIARQIKSWTNRGIAFILNGKTLIAKGHTAESLKAKNPACIILNGMDMAEAVAAVKAL